MTAWMELENIMLRQIPYDLTYKRNLMNKNKLKSKIEPECGNTEHTDSNQRGGMRVRAIMVERREGTSQITCINGPWTWTTVRAGRGGQRVKKWDNCNRITIKKGIILVRVLQRN